MLPDVDDLVSTSAGTLGAPGHPGTPKTHTSHQAPSGLQASKHQILGGSQLPPCLKALTADLLQLGAKGGLKIWASKFGYWGGLQGPPGAFGVFRGLHVVPGASKGLAGVWI